MDDIARHTSNGDHVTVVLLDHCGQELADRPKVSHRINFKSLANEAL